MLRLSYNNVHHICPYIRYLKMVSISFQQMDSHLKKFVSYLQSFGGGGNKPELASKHAEQAHYLASKSSAPIDSSDFMMDIARVIDDYLHSRWQPNTLRTYLNSLKLFLDFLANMSVLGLPDFAYNVPVLQTLNDQCLKWSKSCTKEYRKTKGTKQGGKAKINPSDLQAYLGSERAKEATGLLERGAQDEVTMSEHTTTRNHLLFQLAMANCQRTGCLTNLTVEEFQHGRNPTQRGDHIVLVADHKTASKYGPANIVMSPTVYRHIACYIRDFRPAALGGTDPPKDVFVNWGGSSMDSGSVTHALTTELAHAGVEKRLTCTGIRHLAVSILSGVLPEEDLKDLSGLMTHSRAMAEGTYNDSIKGAKMARISTIARKVLTEEPLSASDLSEAHNGNQLILMLICSE